MKEKNPRTAFFFWVLESQRGLSVSENNPALLFLLQQILLKLRIHCFQGKGMEHIWTLSSPLGEPEEKPRKPPFLSVGAFPLPGVAPPGCEQHCVLCVSHAAWLLWGGAKFGRWVFSTQEKWVFTRHIKTQERRSGVREKILHFQRLFKKKKHGKENVASW